MGPEDEIREEIEDFLEKTCITAFIFERADPVELIRLKKKTPIGTWEIKSVELGYFINKEDQVVIGILKKGTPGDYQCITRILTEYATKSR
jgi:hypothetical protein